QAFAWSRARLRHWSLLHRKYRFAGAPIEYKQLAAFCRLHQSRDRLPAPLYIQQRRLRRDVIIPEIVMHGLERPAQRAGYSIKCNNRTAEAVFVRRALGAPIIGRRIAERQINEAKIFVRRGRGPGIWRRPRVGFADASSPAPAL